MSEVGIGVVSFIVGAVLAWLLAPKGDTSELASTKALLQEKINELNKEKDASKEASKDSQKTIVALEKTISEYKTRLDPLESSIQESKEKITELLGIEKDQRKEISDLNKTVSELTTKSSTLAKERDLLDERIETLTSDKEDVKKQAELVFENIANKVLKEKTETFNQTSEKKLDELLAPFKNQIDTFKQDINEKYNNEANERFSLKSKIDELVNLNNTITQETKNLTSALKGDVKKQGNWGEFKLELLLERSGLEKGKEYIVQGKGLGLKNEEGNNEQPDFIIVLPENKHIIVDSKVSLISYTQYVEAMSEDERNIARAALLKSTRDHIDNLSSKNYYHNEKLIAPEFTFLFSPFEGALSLIIDMNVPNLNISLMQYAWEKKIAIVTPMTLMASLKTIASLWRFAKQESNAIQIAESAAKIYDKFHGFAQDMEAASVAIKKAAEKHGDAFSKLNTGRDNIYTQFEKLKKLGVKPKKNLDLSNVQYLADEAEEVGELES